MRRVVIARARHAHRCTSTRGVNLDDPRRVPHATGPVAAWRPRLVMTVWLALGCGPNPTPRGDDPVADAGMADAEETPARTHSGRARGEPSPGRGAAAADPVEAAPPGAVATRAESCRAAHPADDARARHVIHAACGDMAALDIPGLVILVREGDLTRFELALGSTDLAGRHPVVPAETAFRIGSLTKLVTTWLALEAARDGKISLDASLATYLPELQDAPPGAVTIRELLAHRSGLPEVEPRDLRLSGTSTWLGRVASLERERHPGFAYRNLDHALVGEALLRVHETTWPELVRARAGAAVGLDIHADLAIEARISPGHPRWPGGTQRMSVTHRAMLSDGPLAAAFTHPSGGLVATADALARLVRALTTSREAASSRRETASLQVSPDTRALLLTRTSSADEPCWTLGFACLDRGAALPAVLRHAGNTGDSSAEVWADPATDRVVVVLANAPEFPRNAALAAVQRYLELDPESIRMAYTRGHPVGPGMELPP